MAKVQKILNIEVPAGKATPTPPLGPMLGANGVNIGQFTKEFNEKTADLMKQFGGIEVKIKVKLTVFVDRTFTMEIGAPITSGLIKWRISQNLGSGEPNKKKVGKLTLADLEAIYELKKSDLNANDKEAAFKIIAGTARNMGVDVEM
ncbi:MAG: 50S ribosomal protein L11 [candidate division SR1 bacterium]|jgi:ribosomal protein L11|nr:50S ribosomal protein L11 [candidate division SR1 bacterium]MBB1579116.1 50S ribosomal protein L11 [candidate division SR1 bacterium]RKW20966.1 MAG: 50S ribosomal protein L11 [Candidatus Gracilibacteria bacterium]